MRSEPLKRRPIIIGIGGFTSEVGKTTLLCNLLKFFPGWEAIKTTRGHYRSCGKDPHACCVSHLLSDEPVVRSGYELTYERDKDTGRYWDAGAANVHWVIATDGQVEPGINRALDLVRAPGVFVEGNSFTEFVRPDFFVMVARADKMKMKTTARRALKHTSAIYLSAQTEVEPRLPTAKPDMTMLTGLDVPVFSRADLPQLVSHLQTMNLAVVV